ncbi:MAG: PLP-dependent aminotransferase family protein [Pseudomonadota bacterium]
MDYLSLLSERTRRISASAIREILKAASRPGMISLAGGIPAPESFPIEIIGKLSEKIIQTYGPSAFQYDLTEGFPPLRKVLCTHLSSKDIFVTPDEILITSGSQGALDAIGKILISPGDVVAVEAPTYLGAIQAFNPYEPHYINLETDDDGLIPSSLEKALSSHRVKFIYLVPTFQNPTGRTISLERRREIASIIIRHNVLLVEDDPYGDLRYRGKAIPSIKTMAPDHVIYLSTLSKVFAPGLRIGFCLAPEVIQKWLVIAKQGVDLHTSTFNQALAAEYIAGNYLEKTVPKIIRIYQPRLDKMLDSLDRYFPEEFYWSRPDGGMFIWAEGPEGMDMQSIYQESLRQNVTFVPGRYFYTAKGQGMATMRLNFTMAGEAAIDDSIKTIAAILKKRIPGKAA